MQNVYLSMVYHLNNQSSRHKNVDLVCYIDQQVCISDKIAVNVLKYHSVFIHHFRKTSSLHYICISLTEQRVAIDTTYKYPCKIRRKWNPQLGFIYTEPQGNKTDILI